MTPIPTLSIEFNFKSIPTNSVLANSIYLIMFTEVVEILLFFRSIN